VQERVREWGREDERERGERMRVRESRRERERRGGRRREGVLARVGWRI
jgi:hypothetical protein